MLVVKVLVNEVYSMVDLMEDLMEAARRVMVAKPCTQFGIVAEALLIFVCLVTLCIIE
jgi:hypothetical protein